MDSREIIKRKRIGAFATMSYATYVRRLKTVCKKRKFLLRELGWVNAKIPFFLYEVILNPRARGETICICAGIHGSEESGPLAILEFLKQVQPRSFRNTKVIIFPCANPTGFNAHKRLNSQGYDLNRRFIGRVLPEENRLMLEVLQKNITARKLTFFLSLHEHDARSVFFHVYGKSRMKAYRILLESQERHFPLVTGLRRYHYTLQKGLSFDYRDGSFDDRLNRDGVPYCITAEIPTLYPIQHMMDAQVELMNAVISFVVRL